MEHTTRKSTKFSDFVKEHRLIHGTVRQFAKENGFDVAYVSRLENGVTLPPRDHEKLRRIGLALGLVEGTEEWQEFLDLAAIAKSELPVDLQDSERVASVLPAFYRTLRKEKLDENEIKELIELIKDSEENDGEGGQLV